jgi:hypothetical protein
MFSSSAGSREEDAFIMAIPGQTIIVDVLFTMHGVLLLIIEIIMYK